MRILWLKNVYKILIGRPQKYRRLYRAVLHIGIPKWLLYVYSASYYTVLLHVVLMGTP
jgi:hypothetical protein